MPIDINLLSVIVANLANLLTLLVGSYYCLRPGASLHLRVLFFYMLISFTVEVFANPVIGELLHVHIASTDSPLIPPVLYNIFTICEMITFSWLLFRLVRSRLIKRVAVAMQIIFLALFILQVAIRRLDRINGSAILIESIMCIMLCLAFFRELVTLPPRDGDLLKEHSFWLVIGIFFYFATTFPLFIAKVYLDSHGMYKISKNIYCINNFALVITYLLFIKGYTCRTRKS